MRILSESVAEKLLAALILPALLSLTGASPSYANDPNQPTSPWSGQEVFQNKGCANCHAVHGSGGHEGPDLGEKRFYGTRLKLAALMWNHLPEMIERMQKRNYEFPRLSANEMEALVTYLCYQRYAADEGKARLGRRLLEDKKCVVCHKFGGEGGDVGPDFCSSDEYFSPLKMVTSMWNHGPDMMPYFEEQGIKRPEFKRNEIIDLAAGIRSYMRVTRIPPGSHDLGNAVKGKALVKEKGCLHCHSVNGEGGDIGPDFTSLDFSCSLTEIAGRMWNHGPRMWEEMEEEDVAFPSFTMAEMASTLAYLFELDLEDPPGDPRKGRHTVETTCSRCHNEGEGGMAPDLESLGGMQSPLEMIAQMWNHAPGMKDKHTERDMDWPKLDDRQMAHLFAYLSNSTPGKR